jgi:thymidine phosphorylase
MLVLAGVASDETDAVARVRKALESGAGVEKFREIIEAQGGDPHVIDHYGRLPKPTHREAWEAPRDGVVVAIDAELVGRAAVALGAGRDRAEADVDPAAGVDLHVTVGTRVRRGDPVLTLESRETGRIAQARALINKAVAFGDQLPPRAPLVLETIHT